MNLRPGIVKTKKDYLLWDQSLKNNPVGLSKFIGSFFCENDSRTGWLYVKSTAVKTVIGVIFS